MKTLALLCALSLSLTPALAQYTPPGGQAVSGNQSLTNGHIWVGDGTGKAQDVGVSGDVSITNTGAVTVLKINGSSPAAKIGGDGSGGALSLNTTEANITQYNGTTVSVADGATETLKSGSVINATSTITIGGGTSGALTVSGINAGVAGGGTGASGSTGNCAFAFTPGTSTSNRQLFGASGSFTLGGGGGGGGAFWGSSSAGGNSGGGGAGGGGQSGIGGSTVLNNNIVSMLATGGTGGGGAGGTGSSNVAQLSGANSGKLTICAGGAITISANATCNVNGGTGAASVTPDATTHGGGGGGGGAAGVGVLYSLTSITVSGTLSANGGAGGAGGAGKSGSNGNGGGGGGGGSPGIIVRMSPSNGGAGTFQAIGGAGGGAGAKDGTGVIGVAGTSNTGTTGLALSITGTPNFPLIVMHEKYLVGSMGQLAELKKDRNGEYRCGAKENTSVVAALECSQRKFDGLAFAQIHHHLLTSTEWVPDNAVAILHDASKMQTKLDDFTCEALENPENGFYCGGLDDLNDDRT